MKLRHAAVFLALSLSLLALRARLQWVEVRLGIRANGITDVIYYVNWKVEEGLMHGFYLEGIGAEPHFNLPGCRALYKGKKYPISIKRVAPGRYDVFYSKGFPPGEVIFIVHFAENFFREGFMALTESPRYGKLVVLNWAPAQWDQPLQHQTIYLHFPVKVGKKKLSFEEASSLGLLTERWMNRRYRMFYFGQKGSDGSLYFSVGIYRENLAAREKMPVQLYLPARYFKPSRAKKAAAEPEKPAFSLSRYFGYYLILSLVFAFFMLLIQSKRRKRRLALQRFRELSWVSEDWVPPKIVVQSFRRSGKVAKLDLVEALFLLGAKVNDILTLIALQLEEKNVIKVVSTEPVRLQFTPYMSPQLTYYEQYFLAAVKSDGTVDRKGVEALLKVMADRISEKSWDCDL